MPGVGWMNENNRPEALDAWLLARRLAREHAATLLLDHSSDRNASSPKAETLFLVSDLDEIPNANAINQLKACRERETDRA